MLSLSNALSLSLFLFPASPPPRCDSLTGIHVLSTGPLRPNWLLDPPADLFSVDAASAATAASSFSQTQEKSLYAKKRDKKMTARSGNTAASSDSSSEASAKAVAGLAPAAGTMPRYVNAQDFVKNKTKDGATLLSSTDKVASSTSQPVAGGLSAAMIVKTGESTVLSDGSRQHLLGGHGVVFRPPDSDSKPSTDVTTTDITSEPPLPPTNTAVTSSSSTAPPTTTAPAATKPQKVKIPVPPKKLLKSVGQAISDWRMIEDGDRLLLGLSGGKDSLCMLHLLRHFQRIAPVRFTLACATVDPQTG